MVRLSRHANWLALGLTLASPSTLLAATTEWITCPPPDTADALPDKPILRPPHLDQEAVYLEADQAIFREQGLSELQGNVYFSQYDQHLYAESITLNNETQAVNARTGVYLTTPQFQFSSDTLSYNFKTQSGQLSQVAYLLNTGDGHGSSTTVQRIGQNYTKLEKASYTTCPVGQNSWSLNAEQLEFDHTAERGTARQVTFNIYDKPIIYLPYFTFPLNNERQSGLLTPNVGTDEKSGVRLSIPYYFNLAPNYDLTVTGNFLSKRGLQANSEFRYLFNQHQGELTYEVLPNDAEYNDETRYFYQLEHTSQFDPSNDRQSQLDINVSGTSDKDYFNDLGTSLAASSTVNLERTLKFTTAKQEWSFSALMQDYQILDSSTESYARLPQLHLTYVAPGSARSPSIKAQAEYTYFTKNSADDGQRLDLKVNAKQRFANSYSYLEPALTIEHTHYFAGHQEQPAASRTLPTFSLDTGAFLERTVFNAQRIQTLEPSLYYTFTPYKKQDDLPLFDTTQRTFDYSQLFNDRLFTGKDRIADANRLTTSLTTRLQRPTKGREIFRASVGQMYYFDERKVTLPQEKAPTNTRSEVVFEGAGELNASTRLTATAFMDTQQRDVTASQIRLNYRDEKQRVLNLGYGQRQNEYEAAHVSAVAPLNRNWTLIGAYERDLQTGRSLEGLAGLEYQTCCWKTRIASRNYLLSDNKTYDNTFFVEFELKGLGSFGSGTRNLLENRIYGYE